MASTPPTINTMAETSFVASLPSPASSIANLDLILSPIPEGTLTEDARAQLQFELEYIQKSLQESQHAYNAAYASIPTYQQLVLTTHAQVASAKQAVLRAKGLPSASSSASTSSASSPPSPCSPLNNHLHHDMLQSAQDHDEALRRLEQEHVDLGLKLSQVLRDKAEAEETKKRLSDYMLRAKARIKEIEQKLVE